MATPVPPKPWKSEYAKSGRSSCKSCKSPIAQDSLRLGKMVTATQFDGFMPMWNHAGCIFKKGGQIKSFDDVEGVDLLRWEDQQKIRSYVEGGGSSTKVAKPATVADECTIEASQTSRAACKHCNEKIMKGMVRISTKSEGTRFKGVQWYHAKCYLEMSSSTDLQKVSGWDSLSPEDQETVSSLVRKGSSRTQEVPDSKGGPSHQVTSKGTKRKQVNNDEQNSKISKSDGAPSKGGELESELEKQSKALWTIKDELKKHVTNGELREMLEANGQDSAGSEYNLRERCADGMLFGVLEGCPLCSGSLSYASGRYSCHGYLSAWSKCSYSTTEPTRLKGKWKIPEGTSNEYLLKWFKSQKMEKPHRVLPPTSQTSPMQSQSSTNESLGSLKIVLAGKFQGAMDEWKKTLEEVGGKVHTKLKKDTSCMVVGEGGDESEIKKARRLKIPVVREDYLAECIKKRKKLPFDTYKVETASETSRSGMVTVKVKGNSAVHESSGLQDTGHILEVGKSIYNTTLNMSDRVQCSNGQVSSIMLDGLGLAGSISFWALAGLHDLRNLSISNNRLTGFLGLDFVGSLEFLDLSRNLFAGQLPSELARMDNLVHLNLSSNRFGGTVPTIFANSAKMKILDLCGNRFFGDVGGVLAQLQSAVHVDLSRNWFSGSLKSISDSSSITSSLQYLNISHNGLSGKLFAEDPVPLFYSLEVFDASFNQLSGNVPSFNFLVSLRILRLCNNQLSGSLPEALFKGSSMALNELDLSSNLLSGPITKITSATIKILNLSRNQLSGSLPVSVGNCTILNLSNNKLSGNLSTVESWGNYVEVLDLSSNMLTGISLNAISQFPRLISFKASNNLLVGEIPLTAGTCPELNVVDLSVNKLYGPLPPSLFTSLKLTNLNLSGNSFTGRIPFPNSERAPSTLSDASFSTQTPSLAFLDLSNNLLDGVLPPEINTMGGLKLLNIGRNNISGWIPKEIGMLQSLQYLDLSNNHFEGSIPDHLPHRLLEFNASYNNLSGIVPRSLMRFPESSFHPGNFLLIFPHVHPLIDPDFTDTGKHNHHMKYAVRYALIMGGIACATVILLSTLFYHKADGKIGRRRLPLSHLYGHHETVKIPPASSFSQDQLLQLRSVSMPVGHEGFSSAAGEFAEPEIQESLSNPVQHEMKRSLSLIISSPRPHNLYLDEHPPIVSVRPPEKLSGHLHLFDKSFVFTTEELSRAPAEIIGRSCHGTSYKATLDSGHMLTVKWLREGIWKSKKEFAKEAKKFGNIRHPNIVLIRGYYWGPKEHERLIISDYINATPLTSHICEFDQRKLHPLSLPQRLNIAIDVARGLSYLHNERAIPHGNIKSTNILIQHPNLTAYLTSYCLHRLMTPSGMAEQVLNAGALGYRPPEHASTSNPCPSLKGDIYAFGVILLELLTGKSAGEIVSGIPGVVDLTDWVRLLASEKRSYQCFDKLIVGVDDVNTPPDEIPNGMLKLALRCICSESERPDIKAVFEELISISS